MDALSLGLVVRSFGKGFSVPLPLADIDFSHLYNQKLADLAREDTPKFVGVSKAIKVARGWLDLAFAAATRRVAH